ncbi:unnamed protein product [Rodentolepis nana]|uniref:RNA-directed RNA polymerase n=1 Tax=Rodentolepis nana TaxID=102285 RepID=A0A0R3THB3_RODNA|nr:unnamed protein product [Rodentolepis nana]
MGLCIKLLAGSVWGCARSTLNTTYKMLVQSIMPYCCEPLITATEVILNPLEKAHNQALRPTHYSHRGSTTICSLIKEMALILYEKLPHQRKGLDPTKTSENAIWFNTRYKSIIPNVSLPMNPLADTDGVPLPMNPLADTDVEYCIQLLDYFSKSNTPPEQMLSLALETINVNYPADQWLQ